jgi:hypothetical protein
MFTLVVDHLGVLTSKSNEIFPFSLCVNIRARKLYTFYKGMEGVVCIIIWLIQALVGD